MLWKYLPVEQATQLTYIPFTSELNIIVRQQRRFADVSCDEDDAMREYTVDLTWRKV